MGAPAVDLSLALGSRPGGKLANPAPSERLFALEDVCVALTASRQMLVHNVSFAIRAGELFGLAGESGSGKTMLMKTAFGLHDDAYLVSGAVTFGAERVGPDGHRKRIRKLLGHQIGFVPQDPFSSLNPTMRVGRQIREALWLGKRMPPNSDRARSSVLALLGEVGIPSPEQAAEQYPGQFSGGMRQRIVIAIALSQEPSLLIADEPTTALDAHTQRRIIDLIIERSRNRGLAVILISHNLELLRQNVDRIAVMYGGQLLNILASDAIGRGRAHPYTEALFTCIPRKDTRLPDLRSIPGEPVGAGFGITGCAFSSRCKLRQEICRSSTLPTNLARADEFDACLLRSGR